MDLDTFLAQWHSDSPTVLVHTSGSTGRPKPMRVEKRRMEASARMTCRFLGLHEGDTALLCMSLDYIAGKMMVVRALTCGLRLLTVLPTGHPLAQHPSPNTQHPSPNTTPLDFAAMVPLQVWNSLQVAEERERLRQIRHLLIGGGAIDDALAAALADFPHQVWSSYGMTETLSHIALRRVNGPERSEWYTPLEGVTVALTADGCLTVDAPALHDGRLTTNDIAELRPDGTFRILGRKDNVICSGGIKIQAEEVERCLRPHLSAPFLITQVSDERFGQAVVLLVESHADADGTEVDSVRQVCRQVLPKYWQPRHIIAVERIPLTATAKPARAAAAEMAAARLSPRQGSRV